MTTGQIHRIQLGSTFRSTWVSSGVTASPIQYRILSGSETIVSTYAGVDSGNGHYYADAVVNTAGLWRGEWFATVGVNTYRSGEYLEVYPYHTDQPGRYVTWDEVVGRYIDFGTAAGAVKAASVYISMAEARIDAALGAYFSTPFSSDNMTIKDLAVDMTYLIGARLSDTEYERIKDSIDERIKALIGGTMVMITSSGANLASALQTAAWSDREDYHPAFGMSDPLDWGVGSAELLDEENDRG